MIKKYKWTLIFSSIVILLPLLLGFFGGSLLPEEIAIHWGFNGQADGFASANIFFILPPVMLAVHWICIILTTVLDKKNAQNQSKKLMNIVFWLIPAISLATSGMIFTAAMGFEDNAHVILYVLLAIMFIVIGNYMPKATRSVTTGIKIKWTMANDENWQATHRLAGKCYVIAGLLCLVAIPLPMVTGLIVMLATILIASIIPAIYSYCFYKKQLREGTATKEDYDRGIQDIMPNRKSAKAISIVIISIVLVILFIIMFTGKLEITPTEAGIEIEATFISDATIKYSDIDSVEYRENGVDGVKFNGFNSAKLLLGGFKNEEFGLYTRYTHAGDKPAIVITSGERIIVLGDKNAESTRALYEKILCEISK